MHRKLISLLAAGASIATLLPATALVSASSAYAAQAPKNMSVPLARQFALRPGNGLGSDIRCYQRYFHMCLRRKRARWDSPAQHEAGCRLLAKKKCDSIRQRI